jgi:hypothetical protein
VEQVQVAGQINNNNSISVVVFHGFYGFDIELCHEDAKRITDGLVGGSGTAMVAAQKSGRLARLIEYDPGYCDVILRRFEAVTGASAILARTGQTFEDVAAICAKSETSHDPDQDRPSTIASGEEVQ